VKLRFIGVVCLEDLDAIRKDGGGLFTGQDADVVGASLQESLEDWDAEISASLFLQLAYLVSRAKYSKTYANEENILERRHGLFESSGELGAEMEVGVDDEVWRIGR
jgi:hypothetical protein